MNVPTLSDTLALLAQGVGTGFVLAFLLEWIKPFQDLPADKKRWIVLAISLALPLLATSILQFVPKDTITFLEPYWRALATGFLLFAGSQATHLWSKTVTKDG
jgi:hypothetical protein